MLQVCAFQTAGAVTAPGQHPDSTPQAYRGPAGAQEALGAAARAR